MFHDPPFVERTPLNLKMVLCKPRSRYYDRQLIAFEAQIRGHASADISHIFRYPGQPALAAMPTEADSWERLTMPQAFPGSRERS
jgi:hypothetical protein